MRAMLVGAVAGLLCGCSSVRGFLYPADPMSVSDDRQFRGGDSTPSDGRALAHVVKVVGLASPVVLPVVLAAEFAVDMAKTRGEIRRELWLTASPPSSDPATWPASALKAQSQSK